MGKKILSSVSIVAFAAITNAGLITFDEFPAMNWDQAPSQKIAEQYVSIGVHFVNSDDGSTWDGLSNGNPGNWDLEGTNGDNFIGYNGGSYSSDVLFDFAATGLTFDVSRSNGSSAGNTFTVRAYDENDVLVEQQTISLGEINQWSTITLVSNNVHKVDWLGEGTGFHPFGIDNVRWETASVPEPSSLTLFILGISGLVAFYRKRIRNN